MERLIGCTNFNGKVEWMHGRMVFVVPVPASFVHKCGDCGSDATVIVVETPSTVKHSNGHQPEAWAYCGQCSIGG